MILRLLAAAALLAAYPAAAMSYTVTPLDKAGDPTISPVGIGPDGTVVGQTNGSLQPVVRRPDGTVTVLPTLGGPRGGALAINAAGTIVGGSRTGATVGSNRPYVRAADGTTTVIPIPEGADLGAARAINAAGTVAGDFRTGDEYRTFVRDAVHGTTVLDLRPGVPHWDFAGGINVHGVVAGVSQALDFLSSPDEIFRWSAAGVTTMTSSDPIANPLLQFGGIDDDGTIAGSTQLGFNQLFRGTIWNTAGVATDVGVLAGDNTSELLGINNHGVAVGFSGMADAFGNITGSRVVSWTRAGGLRALDIDYGGFAVPLSSAIAINDAGQILAYGPQGSDYVGAILNPVGGVPEPASWALLVAGFVLTAAASRLRRAVAAG